MSDEANVGDGPAGAIARADAPMPWVAGPGAALPPAPPLWALWAAACALDTGSPLAGVYAGEYQRGPVLGVAWVAVTRDGREVRV